MKKVILAEGWLFLCVSARCFPPSSSPFGYSNILQLVQYFTISAMIVIYSEDNNMKASIDKTKCIKCGFCTNLVKSVFSFNSEGEITVSQINPEDEKKVKKASLLCEANAISLDSNEKIKNEPDSFKVNKKLEHYKACFNVLCIVNVLLAILVIISGFFIASYYTAIVIGDKLGISLFLLLVLPIFLFLCFVVYRFAKFIPEFYLLICELFIKILSKEENNNTNNNLDDLKKLKELLDAGVITQEEFDAKKKQLLGL